MSTELIIEQLRLANPATADRGPSLDQAWSMLQLRLDSPKRDHHVTRWLMYSRGTSVHLRRRVTMTAALSLVMGLVIVGATLVTVNRDSNRNFTGSFGNATWQLVSDQGPAQSFASTGGPQGLDEMTCATAQVCYLETQVALGSPNAVLVPTSYLFRSKDAGSTWTSIPIPTGTSLDTPVSCFGPDSCMVGAQTGGTAYSAVGTMQEMLTTTDAGATWVTLRVPMAPVTGNDLALDSQLAGLQGSLTQLKCFNSMSCIGFGTVPSDQPEWPLISPLEGVSRTVLVRTQNGGSTWSSTVLPWSDTPTGTSAWSNAQPLTATCTSSKICVGIATVLAEGNSSGVQSASMLEFRTTDSGVTWTSNWIPNIPGAVTSLTCPDGTHCLAAVEVGNFGARNGSPEVLSTSDGGVSWQLEPVFTATPSTDNGLTAISCSSINNCMASGFQKSATNAKLTTGEIFVTTDGGHTWTPSQLPTGLGTVTEVDCASPQTCLAIAQPPYLNGAPAPSGPMPSDILKSDSGNATSS